MLLIGLGKTKQINDMNKINLLDCTLRDGGFVNDWQFGTEHANSIVQSISETGMDYVEIGFLRNEANIDGRMVFNTIDAASATILKSKAKRGIMLELSAKYPLDKIPDRKEDSIEMIRVMIWKTLLKEGLDYCKALIDKGYEVGVQAIRTDDYTEDEFKHFVDTYNEINPLDIYVVDSFGVMHKEQILNYATIADEYLREGILLGYHAHNNMQQAYINAVSFLEREWKHPLMLDASVLGMGRGAGNLNTELLLHYLNTHGSNYNLVPVIEIANRYIKQFWAILLILFPIALIFSEGTAANLQNVAVIFGFPGAILVSLVVIAFFKDAGKYLQDDK